ncbi:MAG: hypothetical protein SFY66_00910 [Oculatellaceae cyanobacterium bins.114]|nr:hypothetical protein [Oculatellaceae cyanobacterium bins.114]
MRANGKAQRLQATFATSPALTNSPLQRSVSLRLSAIAPTTPLPTSQFPQPPLLYSTFH